MSALPNYGSPRGRWYFSLRAVAALLDYGVLWTLLFAYTRYFGEPLDEGGYQVEGCGHFLLLIAAWTVWLPLPEAIFGRTFGKWACDLRVLDVAGGAATLGQVFTRRVFDIVDLGFFGLVAYIVAKNTPLAQRVGDLVGKTRVVEDVDGEASAA